MCLVPHPAHYLQFGCLDISPGHVQLIEERVRPGEGSPAARAQMEELLKEMGYNMDDYADDYASDFKESPKEAPAQQQPSQAQQPAPGPPGIEVRAL